MKKILCVLMAVMALGCLAGCVDHDDGKCDNCGTEGGLINKVTKNEEGDKELCTECWVKELGSAIEEELMGSK